MDNSVSEYRLRRKSRLDRKSADEFRERRARRLLERFDDEEENGNNGNSNRGGSGGHGNTKIPFGLCQREGITIQSGWSPKDAWDALAGKGYTASGVYKQLKATGKVGGKTKITFTPYEPKKPPTKIEEKHFPSEMVSKTYKKNTMEAVNYINSHCDDGNITEFLSMATAPGGNPPPIITCKRSMSGEGCCVSSTLSASTRAPLETEIAVPMFAKAGTEEEKAQAIRSFCHEWTHYIDLVGRDGEAFDHFSEHHKGLRDAIDKETEIKIGDEVKKTFDEYNRRYDELKKEHDDGYAQIAANLVKKRYGDNLPEWVNEKGEINYFYRGYWAHRNEVHEFNKALKREQKNYSVSYQRKRRALMNGVVSLQGIYDSIYGGRCREQKITKYGHSTRYFTSHPGNKASETLADYVALKATNPSLAEMFRKDKPEIARELDNTIEELTKKLRGA